MAKETIKIKKFLNITLATFLIIIGISYTLLVVLGEIPQANQLSATHLVLLIFLSIWVLFLVSPDTLKRVKLLELSGFKMELLERVQEKQIKQTEALDTISLVIPLLLPKMEQKHLVNLSVGKTEKYRGGSVLRLELRRLRSFGLIEMTNRGYVAHLIDNKIFDLSYYVKLTRLGKRWARQINQLEEKKKIKESENNTSNAEG
ncbi:MAG: hypothetical protein D3923_04700 [Candidatus Electrothrix sp. AR3]|nr:hypothetical protein [Candidatus Electrothrix sp. AR3]